MRVLLDGQDVQAARIQDPYGYRALPQVHGPAVDAVRALQEVLTVDLNAAAENPLIDADGGQVLHNGNFYTAYLGLALDAARMAVFQTAALSAARLGTLVEPAMTGLRPFLASSVPASSGVLALEYVAHSALADIRRLASPATLGTAVLSRGLEELADFSTQAARAATDTVAAYRIVLACELVAAIRGLRLRRLVPAPGPLRDAYELAAPVLDTRIADRPLDADIDAAEGVLTSLAVLSRDQHCLPVEEDALASRELLVVAQPVPGPGRVSVGHGLDEHRGQHGRRGVRVEQQPGADPGREQHVGVARERREPGVADDRGAHAEPPGEPQRLHGLGRIAGQREAQQPLAARLADVHQCVEHHAAAVGQAAHVGVDTPGRVGEVLGRRGRDALPEHGQRDRRGQVAGQFGDDPGVGQHVVQGAQVADLGRHRGLHGVVALVPVPVAAGPAGTRPGRGVERDPAQRVPQRRVAGEPEGGREPGHRRLADPGLAGQGHAGQEGRIRHVVQQVLGDPPLHRGQAAPIQQRQQCVSGDTLAAALHRARPSLLAGRCVQDHSQRKFSHGFMPETR
jgi:hypothetical protein